MAKTATLHMRLEQDVKDNVQQILNKLGLSMPDAINLFFKQVELQQGLPFDVKIPLQQKRVHPLKVNDIKKIMQVIPESLEELWVFGSAVTEQCRAQSDIDLCLVGNTTSDEERKIFRAPDSAVDIIKETPEGFLREQNIKGSIYKEVKDKGLLIYKKGVHIIWE